MQEEEKKEERSVDVASTTSSKKRKRDEFEKEAILQPPMEAIVEKIEQKDKQENVKRRKVAAPAAPAKGRSKSVVEKKAAPKKPAAPV